MIILDPASRSVALSMLALASLTFAMFIWMELVRGVALLRQGLSLQAFERGSQIHELLPPSVVRVGDNYNHLFEVPTVFYAVALTALATGAATTRFVALAWAYVALRLAHSLVQATVNRVVVRFPVFAASWLVLGAMIVILALKLAGA